MDAVDGRDAGGRRLARSEAAGQDRENNRQRVRESDRRDRENHAEQLAASARAWKEANPERVREMNRRWRAGNLDRARELNRESMRRAATRKRRAAEIRRRANESSERWKQAHPEQVREYQRRWREENRVQVRAYYRRYHAKNRDQVNARATERRDADPGKTRRTRKAWADRNKEHLAEYQRSYRSDPDKYQATLASDSAARRLRRRLETAGLPPRQTHRMAARDRRANDAHAAEYFADPALPKRLQQFTAFSIALTNLVLKNRESMREFAEAYVAMRSRTGLPPINADDVMYARALELVTNRMRRVDLLTSRDVAAAVRSAKAALAERAREQQYKALVKRLEAHLIRHSRRLHDDARLENAARAHGGKPTIPVELVVPGIALQEVVPKVPIDLLTKADIRRALVTVRQRVSLLAQGPVPHSVAARAAHGLGI
jgi:hypothetical protein